MNIFDHYNQLKEIICLFPFLFKRYNQNKIYPSKNPIPSSCEGFLSDYLFNEVLR
jgi:hypothetical protein